MPPKILINVGVNPKPKCPSYYHIFFDAIIHLCPGNYPGRCIDLNAAEKLIHIDKRGFHLPSYGLEKLSESVFVEIALQSGISYESLYIPNDFYIIGRVCDLHHLSDPLTSILNYIKEINFNCLIFSSCPQYMHLFNGFCNCYYLPSDIEFVNWNYRQDLRNWSSRSNLLHIDGNLISKFHFPRSYLYNWLLAYGRDNPQINLVKSLERSQWLEKLKKTQVVVQHGLNGNAHPPFLSAISCGALPLIDSASARSLGNSLNVDLSNLTYKGPKDLLSKLRMPKSQLFEQTNIRHISKLIYDRLNHNITHWFKELSAHENDRLGLEKAQQTDFNFTRDSTNLDLEIFYALQYFQEIWRRLSYFSNAESPSISLVKMHNYNQAGVVDPCIDDKTIDAIYQEIRKIWNINILDISDFKEEGISVFSLREIMALTNTGVKSRNYFKLNHFVSDFNLSSSINLTSPLFARIFKNK